MCDKTYDGACKLCGYSEDTPSIPSYLRPKTFLNERYIVGKVLSYNGEGAVYVGYDTATGTKVNIKEFMPDTLCSRKRGEDEISVNTGMLPLYKTYLSEFEDLNKTLMKSRGMAHLQTVLDIFTENNTAYAVYEHINGIPLSAYLSNSSGVLTWEQIKELFPPVFTTLSLMHAAGVIHRGISLSTIYVTDKLELKLTGFSISAARTTNTEIACEVYAGFAAPEQYTNDVNGTWTDV
ncbi:MAG: protein kinase, partial [Oscillospiraceae bacterium]|nr:protein kinase [Oscillospiraceae bacterium]